MAVSTNPGATAFTRTPWGPISMASTRVSCTTAALAMPYAARPGEGVSTAADAMFTIEAEPRALITRAAARQPLNTPLRLTASTRSSASSSRSTTGDWAMMPAMLAMTSSVPKLDTASSTSESTSPGTVTSTPRASARAPASSSCPAVVTAPPVSMSAHSTAAPAAPSSTAVARPMPDAAPVTTATRPARSKGTRASGFTTASRLVHGGDAPVYGAGQAPGRPEQGVAVAGDLLPRQLLGQPHDGERQRHRAVGPEDGGRDLAETIGRTLHELLEEVLLVRQVLDGHRQCASAAVAARQGAAQLEVGHRLEVERVPPGADDTQRRAQTLLVVVRGPWPQPVQPPLDGVVAGPRQEDGPEGRGQRDALADRECQPHGPGAPGGGEKHHLVADGTRGHHLRGKARRQLLHHRSGVVDE